MIKVLAICPNPSDITALYRVVGPLAALHRQDELQLTVSDKLDYVQFSLCDVVLLQRPANRTFYEAAAFVKNWNKPLWLDFDDDLLNVPEDNPAAHVYGDAAKDIIIKCLEMADLCTVSTEAIRESFSKHCKNTVIVPNALNLATLPERDVRWDRRDTIIMWRGGSTHEPDVFTVRQQILDIAKANPYWKFVFMGHDFKWLKWDLGEQYVHLPKMDPAVYMRTLGALQAPVHVVPLEDNPFNRAKSNIALLEATWAGSAVIVPKLPEWNSCSTYSTVSDFETKLQYLMNSPNDMKRLNEDAWNMVQDKYILSKVNKKRLKLIKGLVYGGSK